MGERNAKVEQDERRPRQSSSFSSRLSLAQDTGRRINTAELVSRLSIRSIEVICRKQDSQKVAAHSFARRCFINAALLTLLREALPIAAVARLTKRSKMMDSEVTLEQLPLPTCFLLRVASSLTGTRSSRQTSSVSLTMLRKQRRAHTCS